MQDIEGEIERLQAAIIALEGQRQVLGDEIVDTSLGALREKLGALETACPVSYTHLDVYKRQVLPVGSREIMLTLEAAVCWNRGSSCAI